MLLIRIVGNIASGKTTLKEKLFSMAGVAFQKIDEPVEDNPVLPLFYANQRKYSYPLQTYMQGHLYFALRSVWSVLEKKAVIITDHGLSQAFARVLREENKLDHWQYQALEKEQRILTAGMKEIARIKFIYLDAPPEECLKRLCIRNRDIEKNIPVSYLKKLHEQHERILGREKVLGKENEIIRLSEMGEDGIIKIIHRWVEEEKALWL